jgi:hypothetical protein
LSGRVWIGSGFADDSIRHGTAAAGAAGELGCSDVPGWVDNFAKLGTTASDGIIAGDAELGRTTGKFRKRSNKEDRRFDDDADISEDSPSRKMKDASKPVVSDGTDDYLHHPLPGSSVSHPSDPQPADSNGNHADIQSIQEGAEIAGKIVLLSRGGCGFLEKVKWAQRRGAIALIVGDDTKGGPLIQMYARGDTSNVSIPSVFTSRTTAHLLSSLVGSGNFIEDSVDEKGNPTLKVLHTDKPKKVGKKHTSQPTFTTTTATKATTIPRANSRASRSVSTPTEEKSTAMTTERRGWFKSLFFGSSKSNSKSDSSRPPRSGQLDWVLVEDWKEEDRMNTKKSSSAKSNKNTDLDVEKNKGGDDFVIGVQDWRDPDLVGSPGAKDSKNGVPAKAGGKADSTTTKHTPRPTKSGSKHSGQAPQDTSEYISTPGGGSITPGSGEYSGKVELELEKSKTKDQKDLASGEKPKGLLTTIFGDDEIEQSTSGLSSNKNHAHVDEELDEKDGDDEEYDGLWVTLTPTSGASPFLDTILVLVVSPLITLTVVYALLLVRSRIRRRRWRAPKSVVERLPVRTYQTIATPGHQTPRLPSPSSSSAATPLLQQSPQVRPRPRSRTTTGIPEAGDLVRTDSSPMQMPSPAGGSQEHEKTAGVSPEWKKYMGKQVECVVCLEEYIDGVSRVMSLPCGHEFHADCM